MRSTTADDTGCYGNRSLREAVRRNTVRQMACDSSRRALERQQSVARALLMREERQLRAHLLQRLTGTRIKSRTKHRDQIDFAGSGQVSDDLLTSKLKSDALEHTAEEDNKMVVVNPYPITPRPKNDVSNHPSKANRKPKHLLYSKRHSLDLQEFQSTSNALGRPVVEGQLLSFMTTKGPLVKMPHSHRRFSLQNESATEGEVWLGHPEAINSIRRTLRPSRMAEVRLLRRSQSLREPFICFTGKATEDLKGKEEVEWNNDKTEEIRVKLSRMSFSKRGSSSLKEEDAERKQSITSRKREFLGERRSGQGEGPVPTSNRTLPEIGSCHVQEDHASGGETMSGECVLPPIEAASKKQVAVKENNNKNGQESGY